MNRVLHPAQYDIYTDQILNINSPYYNIGLCIKIKGNLNKDKLQEAIRSSYHIFDAFEMRFGPECIDGHFDLNDEYKGFEIGEKDFSSQVDAEGTARCWMQNKFNIPFIIQKENSLLEQFIIRISEDENWFFFRFHHLVTDAYGLVIWVDYIAKKYKSLFTDENIQLSYPSYLEEAVKASVYRNSVDYKLAAKYWKNKIGEKPEVLLKKTISFKTKPEKKSGNYYLNISSEQKELLDQVIQATQSNLQQLTTAALLIYFNKTLDRSEIVFGLPVHKRSTAQLKQIFGMFSGVLPFKGILKEDTKLKDLIKTIADSRKADYPYQNYLTGDLIRSLNINATESYLYDVIVNYIPFNFNLDFGKGIQATATWLQSEQEKIPLQVCWRDYGNQQPLELGLHYRYEYFDEEEIGLIAQRIIFIISQFHGSVNKDIKCIDIIPQEEKELLNTFNQTFTAFPHNKTIVNLFEEQVLKKPAAIAVLFESEKCTYYELNKRSNRLAHELQKRGVKTETLVPICIERSVDMVVAIFGILKAGGAYVPIDPDYPEERIQFILEETAASTIITSKLIQPKLKNIGKRSIVTIDSCLEFSGNSSDSNLQIKISPNNLAYVIYTSGSTGKPKGVLIEHRGLVNFCKAVSSALKPLPEERVLQFASVSFDVSCEEIFNTLLSGGTVVMPKKEDILSAEEFQKFLNRYKIERATLPPSYQSVMKEALGTLKTIISAGESINASIGKYIQSKGVRLINGYGPTENTISASISDNPINTYNRNIIGKPLANVQVYILDQKQNLLPIGCSGEICLAGMQLARGYLNRPEITAEKFIKNPFSNDPAARVYRTGDLGRWLTDGNLEFLGRADNQVKIRGFRIEPEEIERVLLQSSLVREAMVAAFPDQEGNQRLVCYVVAQGKFNRETLIDFLRSKFPDYMIPALWVQLEKFPLTASGKIDKKALPKPGGSEPNGQFYVTPRNEMEVYLAAACKKLLQIKDISVKDDFFKLGGNSLLAIRLIAQVKKETGKSLPIKYFLENPTVEKLAKTFADNKTNNRFDLLVPLKTEGRKIPFYIVCGAGGTAHLFHKFSKILHPEQPVYVLQQPATHNNPNDFPDTIEAIAAKYIEELLVQNPEGPYALSGHCIGGIIAFEMAKQLQRVGKEVKLLAMFDTLIPTLKQQPGPATFANLYHIPKRIKRLISRVQLKLNFEIFLLRKHTKHAIQYKINSVKNLSKKLYHKTIDNGLDDFRKLERNYQTAYSKYQITQYQGDILVFFAKERYHFVDRNKDIIFKKIDLDDTTKNKWKQYGNYVKVYEVEGEHTTIFHPSLAKNFVRLLEQHLDKELK